MTSLIGTNESVKTNLLLPLWKLNPAKDGEINPIADYPRKQYNEIRQRKPKPVFVEARFELTDSLAERIAKVTGSVASEVKIAIVKRNFSGEYQVSFPDAIPKRHILKAEVAHLFSEAMTTISELMVAGKVRSH